MIKNKSNVGGGYNNYSIRSATLVEGYFPGAMRMNLLLDPNLAIGQYDPGTFGSDQWLNGPGTLMQALPDASKYHSNRIFAQPRGNPYRNFGVDDRQLASYQVEQLHNNPLSQYTNNPNGHIPGFDCLSEPDDFSTMKNKRESEFKNFFETGNNVMDWLQGTSGGSDVYPQYHGKKVNANSELVYNMNIDSREQVNPMIALGSSSRATSQPSFSGKCYSGPFVPGEVINNSGGNNPPTVYRGSHTQPRSEEDRGFMNINVGNSVCIPDKSLNFSNPLILNGFN
jgi:hypothetical protein